MNITEIINATAAPENSDPAQATAPAGTASDFDSYLSSSSTTMDDIFQKASQTYGVSVNLLKAIAKQESNFDAKATSHCGAQGVMQLMPGTAAALGVSDAYDPEQNIMGGAKYISQLLAKYNGDIPLALAAYNAGSGNVAKYGGIPPFKETQNYVAKVTAYMNENLSIDGGKNQIPSKAFLDAWNQGMGTVSEDTYVEDILEQIFSYEDYMRFLEMFLEQMTATKNALTGYDSRQREEDESNALYSYQNINYNPAVMNLMNQS